MKEEGMGLKERQGGLLSPCFTLSLSLLSLSIRMKSGMEGN
jgi:hypothetical protein